MVLSVASAQKGRDLHTSGGWGCTGFVLLYLSMLKADWFFGKTSIVTTRIGGI